MIIGTAIGAGIFGIPFAVQTVGFGLGLLLILGLGGLVMLTNLAYGEVIARTAAHHQLPGYVALYLGPRWAKVVLVASILSISGALLAYILGVGTFLSTILGPVVGGSQTAYSLLFFLAGSTAIYLGLRTVVKIELVLAAILVIVIGFIVGVGLPQIQVENLTTWHLGSLFLPFGVILFACGSATALPAVYDVLRGHHRLFRRAIVLGLLTSLSVYVLFTLTVVGVSGPSTTADAIHGLGSRLGPGILLLGSLFGCLAMSTSFLTLGFILRDTYMKDLHLSHGHAWLAAMVPPFLLFLIHPVSFVTILAIVGGIFGGFDGIMIYALWRKARQRPMRRQPAYVMNIPRPVQVVMIAVYLLGIILELKYILL